MTTNTNYRINLVVDEAMQEILAYFRSKYPLLKDADLIKMAISGFYTNDLLNLPTYKLNEYEEESLQKALKNKTSNDISFDDVNSLMTYLDN